MKTLKCLIILQLLTGLANAFPGPALSSPVNNYVSRTSPTVYFAWAPHPTAHYYWLQVAEDPNFQYMIYNNGHVTGTNINADILLNDNADYYWRVRTYAHDWWNPWNPYWSDWSGVRTIYSDRYDVIDINSSDGDFNMVRAYWYRLPRYTTQIEIYRDNILQGNPVTITMSMVNNDPNNWAPNVAYRDDLESGLQPGRMYLYKLVFKDAQNNILATREDYGFRMPNGQITGRVTTNSNAPVSGVNLSAFDTQNQLSKAISLDGNDYIDLGGNSDLNISQSITLEAWIKSDNFIRSNAQQVVAKAGLYQVFWNTWPIHQYGLEIEANTGKLKFYITSHAHPYSKYQIVSSGVLSNNQWHHVAGTYDGNILRIFIDGFLQGEMTIGSHNIRSLHSNRILAIGRLGSYDTQYYTGLVDEVRLWNITRDEITIYADMHRVMEGDEDGLVGFWRFNAGSGTMAFDYAAGGGHHGTFSGNPAWSQIDKPTGLAYQTMTNTNGDYTINKIIYGELQPEFTLIPEKDDHIFTPVSRPYELGSGTTPWTNANFTDISTFTVQGIISFVNTSCGVEGVDIYLDGIPTMQRTDENGNFTISVTEAGEHTITPQFYDHQFLPSQYILDVQSDLSGYDFSDTTTSMLSGRFYGGAEQFPVGEASILIEAPGGCVQQTTTTTSGFYQLRLPAMPDAQVTISDITPPLGSGYLNASKTISLAEGDTSLDFTFYAEPEIVISGWPESGCNFTIMDQGLMYPLTIDIIERYGENFCTSDSGLIQIYNGINDQVLPLEVDIDSSGRYQYTFMAGDPNFSAVGEKPYQKNMQIFVQTRGGDTDETRWALVTGYSPREQTFVTVSPELPLLILRDPPGDNSYSEMKQTLATSVTTSLGILTDASIGTYALAKAGVQFQAGFLGFSTETKIWGSVSSSIEVGASLLNQTEQQLYISSSTGFKTSDNEEITGAEGDVFVGAAFNILYAITDVLSVNDRCEVELSKSIVYGVDSLKTTYLYTDKYIRNSLIPDLQLLKDMSTDIDDIQKYSDQMEVWQQTLAFNDSLKETAVPIEDPAFNFDYVSFSGDIVAEYQTTVTQVQSRSIYFNMYLNSQVATEAGLEIAGSGFQAGVQVRASLNIGKAKTASTITTNEIGFRLHDNDNGDLFFVKIMGDPVYGTPVYEVLGGKSSNPWEEQTQKRDKVGLLSDSYVQTDLLPQQVAGFNLNITNLSESFEARTYEAVVLNESNPDGAEIKIAGVPVIVPVLLNFEANETKNIVMTIERGPFAYDYDNIKVVVRAPGDHSIADTAAYSAHFQSPCSPIILSQPAAGWVVNHRSNDSLRIIFDGYDKTKMSGIYLQYSLMGRNAWHEGLHVPVNDLPDNNVTLYWQTDSLPDAQYDLRLAVQWNQDITYTSSISGRIDRLPPQPFGDPQPADGVLARGDEIYIVFDEHIAENSVSADKVSLLNTASATAIPCAYSCLENKIIITPDVSDSELENQTLQATVKDLSDLYGNTMPGGVSWIFYVNKNPVYWHPMFVERSVLQNSIDSIYVKINNVGQTDASVTITDAPVWTQLDFSSGTVYANGSVSILVQISTQQLALGTHIDTIFAQTPQGVEPLVIQINVLTEAPIWTVDPASFQYTMTLTGAVFIEDVPFSDVHDRLAAFVGNDVRGVVEVQQIVPQDFYAAFLTIYSNQVSNEQVTLRIWDASEGQIRNINEVYTFVNDTIYGTAASFEYLHVSDILLQQITLTDRWTWISLGVEAKDLSTRTVFKHLKASDGDLIKGCTSYSQYLPGVGWVGTLDTLHTGAGFKLKKSQPDKLDFFGVPVPLDDHPIGIVPGWNWIAYLPGQTMAINDALSLYEAAAGDLIKNKTEQASFSSAQWNGSLTQMIPGMGYMMNCANAGELRYPEASGKQVNNNTIVSAKDYHIEAPAWAVNPNAFEHSMNITGNLTVDGILNADENTLLAAFVDGGCRGVAHPLSVQNKWLYFLTVYADPGETVSFKFWDAVSDQIGDLTQTIIFSPDSLIGSPSRPSAWNTPVSSITGEETKLPTKYALHQNHPNPFNPVTKIRYAIIKPGHVKVTIYDLLGRMVEVLVDEKQEAGYYNISFDSAGLASGTYFYQLQTENFQDVKKMILLR